MSQLVILSFAFGYSEIEAKSCIAWKVLCFKSVLNAGLTAVPHPTECKTNKEDWVRVSKVKHAMQ